MTAVTSLFSVPIWKDAFPNFENLKETFIKSVKDFAKDNPVSEHKSNQWGYQSPKDLHRLPELAPLFNYVTKMAYNAAESISLQKNFAIMEAWANINSSRQCMNHQHTHGGVFSGIFYLKVPEESGQLFLVNPAINPSWQGASLVEKPTQYTSESIFVNPKEGSIIIWPSYLPHAVGTNNHDEERISIAFNLYIG